MEDNALETDMDFAIISVAYEEGGLEGACPGCQGAGGHPKMVGVGLTLAAASIWLALATPAREEGANPPVRAGCHGGQDRQGPRWASMSDAKCSAE